MSQLDLYLSQWEDSHSAEQSDKQTVPHAQSDATLAVVSSRLHQLGIYLMLLLVQGIAHDLALYWRWLLYLLSPQTYSSLTLAMQSEAKNNNHVYVHCIRQLVLYSLLIQCRHTLIYHVIKFLVFFPIVCAILLSWLHCQLLVTFEQTGKTTKMKIDGIKRLQHLTLGKGFSYPLPAFFGAEDQISSESLPANVLEEKRDLLLELFALQRYLRQLHDENLQNEPRIESREVITIQLLTSLHQKVFRQSPSRLVTTFTSTLHDITSEEDLLKASCLYLNVMQSVVETSGLLSHCILILHKYKSLVKEGDLSLHNVDVMEESAAMLKQVRSLRAAYDLVSYNLYTCEKQLCQSLHTGELMHKQEFVDKLKAQLYGDANNSLPISHSVPHEDDWDLLFENLYALEVKLGLRSEEEISSIPVIHRPESNNLQREQVQGIRRVVEQKEEYADGMPSMEPNKSNGLVWDEQLDQAHIDIFVATTDPISLKVDRNVKSNPQEREARNQSKNLLFELKMHSDIRNRINRNAVVKGIDNETVNLQEVGTFDAVFSAIPISSGMPENKANESLMPALSASLTHMLTTELASKLQATRMNQKEDDEVYICVEDD